jgi:hypothetical protein
MKPRTFNSMTFKAVSAAAVISLGVAVAGEQWLQYHTSAEGRSYQWLDLATNAPPGITLPTISGTAYFAWWHTPLDPKGGRWLCFERTKRSGPWNRVYVDGNGNGRLDDENPVEAQEINDFSASFPPLKFVFKGEDGPLSYHLIPRFMKYDENDLRLLVSSAGYYDGKIDLGGQKKLVTLVDGNVNGTFNDVSANPNESDRIAVEGDKAGQRYLGRMLEQEKGLFSIDVARDGAFVVLKETTEVKLGKVTVPESITELTLVGENGHYVRKPVKGEFTIPLGAYRVHEWKIARKDDKGAEWSLTGSGSSPFSSFQVVETKPAVLDVGEPILASLNASENKTAVVLGLRIKGRNGETVEIMKGDQRPRAPRVILSSQVGGFRATNSFEYG